jgi:hypothetical protein
LSPRNQFISLSGLFEYDLICNRFRVSLATVSKIVTTWANFCYLRLGSIDIWKTKQANLDTMPESFKLKYPNTRIIIDAT